MGGFNDKENVLCNLRTGVLSLCLCLCTGMKLGLSDCGKNSGLRCCSVGY